MPVNGIPDSTPRRQEDRDNRKYHCRLCAWYADRIRRAGSPAPAYGTHGRGRPVHPERDRAGRCNPDSGERLEIVIHTLEAGGSILPVELQVYDTDGQQGILIPHSLEYDAAREIAANMGSSMNSSINISTDAGAQIASDVGKGVLQGVSQYITKRMRTVKVTLKAGHRVLLHSPEQ